MRILAVLADPDPCGVIGACDHYRAVAPLAQMALHGHQYTAIPYDEAIELFKQHKDLYRHYDIIQFHRLVFTEASRPFFEETPLLLRSLGVSVIMDYDDDFTNQHRKVHNHTLEGLQNFSAIFVSTPYLKRVMKPYNHNVIVVENAVTPELFSPFKRIIPNLTIGLTGSVTHRKDWEVVVDPLLNILPKYPEVRLFVTGHVPDRLYGHPQVITLSSLIDTSIPDDNHFLSLSEYGMVMQNIDILLCPVDPDDKFNWSKSSNKAIEGMIAKHDLGSAKIGGCAVIATGDLPNYREPIIHGKTGLLVNHHDQGAWEQAIASLIENSAYRTTLQVNGYRHCQRYFTLEARLAERVSAYQQVMGLDRKSLSKVRTRVAALVTSGY